MTREATVLGAPTFYGMVGPIRVLVVDDEEDQFVLVRRLLRGFSSPAFEVAWAGSYSAGLAALAAGAYDGALIDYQLGLTNGAQFIAEAREAGNAVPFILVTGHGDRNVDVEAMHAGAVDYLPKAALDGPALERALRYAITQDRLREALSSAEAQLRAADDVTKALGADGPTTGVLDKVLSIADERLGYGCSAIYLLAGDRLTLRAARGFRVPHPSLPAASGPLGRVLAEGRSAIIPGWTDAASAPAQRYELVVPMKFETRTVGLLTLAHAEADVRNSGENAAVLEIAARVGAAIGLHEERASLAERGRHLDRARQFQEAAIHEPSGADFTDRILARLGDAFSADGFAMALPDEREELIVAMGRGSLADRVGRSPAMPHTAAARARDSRTVQVDSTGMSCAAFVPVTADDRLLGLLWVDRQGLDARYTQAETNVLALLGLALGSVLCIDRERRAAGSSVVRDRTTGLHTVAVFNAMLEMKAAIGDRFGLVVAGPRMEDSLSAESERGAIKAMSDLVHDRIAGGPDIAGRHGRASVAVMVRERAAERTRALAMALEQLTGPSGPLDLAVGWAVRDGDGVASIMVAAEMALELSRRTRTAVEA